jgi:chromosome segregation ATPase
MIVDLALVTVLTLASGAAFAASGDALDVQVSPSIHARLRASEVDEATGTARSKATSALHTRLFDYVNGNANAVQLRSLLSDARFPSLPEDIQARLKADANGLLDEQGKMLPQARALDAEDTTLASERDRLIDSKRKLDIRLADIERQVTEHEAACLPTHPPERHQWCVDNATRLNKLIDAYNKDARAHDAAVAAWRQAVAALEPRWNAFVQVILDWESRVKALVRKIGAYLDSPTGDCSEEEHKKLQKAVHDACDQPRKCTFEMRDCDDLKKRLAINNACAAARDEINNKCYQGGDDTHREEANNARKTAAICQEVIKLYCDGVGVSTWR